MEKKNLSFSYMVSLGRELTQLNKMNMLRLEKTKQKQNEYASELLVNIQCKNGDFAIPK
jgi:hypothetical protein